MTTTQIAALVGEARALVAGGILREYVPNPKSVYAVIGVESSLEEGDPVLAEILKGCREHTISLDRYNDAEQVTVIFNGELSQSNLRGIIFRKASPGLIGFHCISNHVQAIDRRVINGEPKLELEIYPASLLRPDSLGEVHSNS